MGGSGSSSKRKSFKKKTSKTSSQARQRKRSKRNKSKKLRRREDSASYSDGDSRSSVSIPSSSSEDDYRSRRSRSRTRSDVKSSRKRVRRRSSSQESSKDSGRVRKRKRPKRNGNSEVSKKIQKKKPRRDPSISFTSSDSSSCPACRGGSSSSGGEESEFKRPRGRSRVKKKDKKDKRDSGKARSGTQKSKNRSPSYSPCSRGSESSGSHSKEKLAGDNNSRRLRSVITIASQPQEKEENKWDKDEHKEEIVYDHDEYPSCRSNDSNDGGSKRELAHRPYVASGKRMVENVLGEEAFVSDLGTTELAETGKDDGSQYDGNNSCSGGTANNPKKENESAVSVTFSGSDDGDLESILRQKALENLRKFQGGLQTNAKAPANQRSRTDNDVKKLSTAKADLVQINSPKQDGSSVVVVTHVVDQDSRPKLRRDSSHPTWTEEKIHDRKHSGTEPGTAKQTLVCPPFGAAVSGNAKEEDSATALPVTNKSEPGRSALRQQSSGSCATLKQASASPASSKGNLLVTKSILNKTAAEMSQSVGKSSGNNHGVGDSDACGSAVSEPSCSKPTSEGHSSKERRDETKDGSQFEQKTMSVMRGGEMVQVSYKVYIPKKPPALARRQLQR